MLVACYLSWTYRGERKMAQVEIYPSDMQVRVGRFELTVKDGLCGFPMMDGKPLTGVHSLTIECSVEHEPRVTVKFVET